MSIEEKIRDILAENGVGIDVEGRLVDVNSMSFIATIVGIESEFSIEFPDEFLRVGNFDKVDDFVRVVTYVMSTK